QSSEADEFIYHEALVHPAMITHPHPRRVFIAGGGEGAILREVLTHRSVEKVVMVDIDQEAVDICRRFLPFMHQGSFEDNRVELLHLDAREYLTNSKQQFDVIIIDLTDPLEGGSSYLLYTQQFYRLARERLAPDGILSLQAGSCSLRESAAFMAIDNTISSVFPLVFPYQADVPSFGVLWGFSLASMQWEPLSLSVEEVDKRVSTRVSRSLRFYDGLTHRGMFCLPRYLRQEMRRGKSIITNENPLFVH
ncbi:MAG TPA: fused MFS/spermidine synthase, partial [Dehalococcoidia bacterium]|nr:fused MFS/spermidine synthase [Dehalococcoidia bacterium]